MAQELRDFAAFAEDPSLVPSTCRVAHSHLQFQFQGNLMLSSGLPRHCMPAVQRHTGRQDIHTHKIIIYLKMNNKEINLPQMTLIKE